MPWNKLGLAALGLTLTACASGAPALEAHSNRFGEAVAQNIAAQQITPAAEDKTDTFIPPNQARQKAAREAYENGTVKEPVAIGTTE